MKKIILGMALLAAMTCCSSNSYKISGKLEDVTVGTVHLKKVGLYGIEDIDSTSLTGGEFIFEGKVDYPELHLIFYEDKQAPILFFLENANISITASTDLMQDAVIKGSGINNLFKKFNDEIPHQEKTEEMREEFFIAQSSNDEAAMQSIIADMQVIIEEQQKYYFDFVMNNSNNVLGAFLTLNMAQTFSVDEMLEITDKLDKNMPDHPYVEQLKEYVAPMLAQRDAEEALAVGNEAPEFTLGDINGNEISLSDFRGKYVFIDFWAAWCNPCRVENPVLKEVYERFGGKDFEIISISLDETEEAWKKAVKEDGLNWVLLHDTLNIAAQTYMVQSIPNTWLLDKEGNIIEKQIRGRELMDVLENLLEN